MAAGCFEVVSSTTIKLFRVASVKKKVASKRTQSTLVRGLGVRRHVLVRSVRRDFEAGPHQVTLISQGVILQDIGRYSNQQWAHVKSIAPAAALEPWIQDQVCACSFVSSVLSSQAAVA
jgi:hypothetical protein